MFSLTKLPVAHRLCMGRLNLRFAAASCRDHRPHHAGTAAVLTPQHRPWNKLHRGWLCSSSNSSQVPSADDAAGMPKSSRESGDNSLERRGSASVSASPPHPENNRRQDRRRRRQREEAFREKLGYALFKQGGVNLWRRARREARNFEATKKIVQARVEQSKVKVKELRENIFTIPNFLTTTRLALAPYLGYLVVNEQYLLGSSLFVLAGATDLLDGWIARNFKNQQSVLGSIIDPLADKCLISILTITLTYSDLIPVPLTALIILRDVGLMSAAFYLRYQSLPPPITFRRYFDLTHATVQMKPTFISKVNTAVQLSLVGFTILAPVLNFTDHPYLHGLWYLTATTTVLSGLSYCFKRDVFKYLTKGR